MKFKGRLDYLNFDEQILDILTCLTCFSTILNFSPSKLWLFYYLSSPLQSTIFLALKIREESMSTVFDHKERNWLLYIRFTSYIGFQAFLCWLHNRIEPLRWVMRKIWLGLDSKDADDWMLIKIYLVKVSNQIGFAGFAQISSLLPLGQRH